MRLAVAALRDRWLLSAMSFVAGVCLALLAGLREIDATTLPDTLGPSGQLMASWQDAAGRNSLVALLLIAGGVLGGLPTVAMLALNGYVAGSALSAFASSEGGMTRFVVATGPHGILEACGMFLAGAVGLGIAARIFGRFDANLKPPSYRSLLIQGLVAGLLIALAAWIEVHATPKAIALLWHAEGAAHAEVLSRWCAIIAIQGMSMWILFRVYNAIDKSPTRSMARTTAVLTPLWSTLVGGMCIVVYEYYVAAWRTANATWTATAFVMLCCLPSASYGAARYYRTQSADVDRGLWVHAPWLLLATTYLLVGYGAAAILEVHLSDMSRPARLVLSAMAASLAAALLGPALVRLLLAKTLPIDWSDGQYLDTAVLLDRLCYSRNRVRLMEARNGKLINAMASGILPGSSRIMVTTDLVAFLNARELAAVVAHEVGHHRCKHLHVGAVLLLLLACLCAVGIAALESVVSISALDLGPLGGMVVVLWMSAFVLLAMPAVAASCFRFFERQADVYAARQGFAGELASSLEKIGSRGVERRDRSRLGRMLAFHPPWQSRVEQLRSWRPGE